MQYEHFFRLVHTEQLRKPHQVKSERESDVAPMVSCILPATLSKSDFAHDITGNWLRNPFCRDFASEIAFAFALVWLNHYTYRHKTL